ncbi:MAG: peptidyl-prolyl cis-trans isomerase [Desulfonatronovibrionaceae bacterium]
MVATVNDHPIYLDDIEAAYDMYVFNPVDPLPPSVREMKKAYGRVLISILINRLIEQDLAGRDLSVSMDDVLKVEQKIRADYPEGEFEKMLIEEYIDLQYWRKQVARQLAWEVFLDSVLMPKINIEGEDIQKYYQDNIQDFFIPERVAFWYLTSKDQKQLEQAMDLLKDFDSSKSLMQKVDRVHIGEYEMRLDQLPENLEDHLTALMPGEHSDILTGENAEFYCLYLVGHKESRLLKPHQVYEMIEDKILEQKIQAVFDNWLAKAVDNSTIEINQALLDQIR